jgi:hypothetical protein
VQEKSDLSQDVTGLFLCDDEVIENPQDQVRYRGNAMLYPNDIIVTEHQHELQRAAQQQRLVQAAQSNHSGRSYRLAETLRALLRRPAAPKLNARHAR